MGSQFKVKSELLSGQVTLAKEETAGLGEMSITGEI